VIEREILADDRPQHTTAKCFCCGREFIPKPSTGDDNTHRFCSTRCREAFDDGMPPFDPLYASKNNPRWYSLPMGRRGFLITCRGCSRVFDSTGLRCCSVECERKSRRKEQIEAELKDNPFRAIKRKCEQCDNDIPNWRNGRRVSKATRFCSPRCGKNARMAPGGLNPVLGRETAKKCLENGGSR